MSNVGRAGRSFEPITAQDLRRLDEIARQDRARFFQEHPPWAALYGDRVLCVALCQGAALHYLDSATGINDFDVYTFYRQNPEGVWCHRRKTFYDFGLAKFGQSVDHPHWVGRRVDCLGRSLVVEPGDDPPGALRRYLRQRRSDTARYLAQKAVVLLDPQCGRVIWPEDRP